MTTTTRMLQRGLALLATVAMLAAACGDDDTTADGEAADQTAPPATVEETTTDTVTTDTAPPVTQESIVEPTPPTTADSKTQEELDWMIQDWNSAMLKSVRLDCRPWATQVNPEYPIPGTVTAAAVSRIWGPGFGVMIAIEEDPGIVLLFYGFYGRGEDIEIEQAPPLNSEQASTGDAQVNPLPGAGWHPVDEASADYLGLPPDSVSDGWGDETVVAMKECLATIQGLETGTEPSWADSAAEAMGWMADASLAVGDAKSPAEKSATCTAVLADPEKDRAMDALEDVYFEQGPWGAIGRIRDTFHLMMISCKDGHFEDTAQYERRNAAANEELSEALEALGYPPFW